MTNKALQTFIRRSIKAKANTPNIPELHELLGGMTTGEMQAFWSDFVAHRSFSIASRSVPDWKTREQQQTLAREHTLWAYYPSHADRGADAASARADLERHVAAFLLRHIDEERQMDAAFRAAPLSERLHSYLGMAIVAAAVAAIPIGVLLLAAGSIVHIDFLSLVAHRAELTFGLAFGLYLFIPFVWACASKLRHMRSSGRIASRSRRDDA